VNDVGPADRARQLLRRSFWPLLERAGLPRIRFHDLRPTAATLLLDASTHPKVAMEMLGHSTVGIDARPLQPRRPQHTGNGGPGDGSGPGGLRAAKLTPMAIAFQHLVKKPDGVTEIAATGIRVCTLASLYDVGETPEQIAENYSLPLAAVLEALAYAADHPDEIDATNRADMAVEQSVIDLMPEPFRDHARQVAEADEREYQELVRKVREARRGTAVP